MNSRSSQNSSWCKTEMLCTASCTACRVHGCLHFCNDSLCSMSRQLVLLIQYVRSCSQEGVSPVYEGRKNCKSSEDEGGAHKYLQDILCIRHYRKRDC